jgi:hypothetical protein
MILPRTIFPPDNVRRKVLAAPGERGNTSQPFLLPDNAGHPQADFLLFLFNTL